MRLRIKVILDRIKVLFTRATDSIEETDEETKRELKKYFPFIILIFVMIVIVFSLFFNDLD